MDMSPTLSTRERIVAEAAALTTGAGWAGVTMAKLADRVGVTVVNLSVLKNGRAKAVRFSTLTRVCRVLDCQPGDILRVE